MKVRLYMAKKPVIVLMYDFDNTLSPSDMQTYTFMPMVGTNPAEFWSKADELCKSEKMDPNLAYMYLMLEKAKEKGIRPTRKWMVGLGQGVQLYPGLTKWFERLGEYASKLNCNIEHYVISSGIKEMIEGTNIYKYFTRVYACEYFYGEDGTAVWPKNVVNYTTKTQFLFRISKGAFELDDSNVVNQHMPEIQKHAPFRNMIYIGDGSTDIPCVQLVRDRGGESIAVYPDAKNKAIAENLLAENRVSFIEKADYSANSSLDKIVKEIIDKMVKKDLLEQKRNNQTNQLPDDA